ncbi:MAG: chemotaxis protein CheW [Burkholderiales bacterium]
MTDDDAELLDDFLLEAREIMDKLDLDFVQLEKSPDDDKLLGNIFRGMHTLKGSSGFFSFKKLEQLSHAGESLLSKLRDKSLRLSPEMVTILLKTLDALRHIIDEIEANRVEPVTDDELLLVNLRSLTDGGGLLDELPLSEEGIDAHSEDAASGRGVAIENENSQHNIAKSGNRGDAESNEVSGEDTEVQSVVGDSESPGNAATVTTDTSVADHQDLVGAVASPNEIDAEESGTSTSKEVAPPVKVSVELLDTLMNLVSEMVLARNRLLSYASEVTDPKFAGVVRNVDFITLELQERMMKTRMSPISQVWNKFPRLVRDLSQECQKRVELIQIGAETELDRTLLETIKDPLIHIIRNCVDHGIEEEKDRVASGKVPVGSVTLQAKHENGMVVIQIADDGGGINFDRVRAKAIQRGLIDAQKASRMSAEELLEFIYLPGFSTKEAITNLSGRGVGMDVVKTNIQNIGGSVEVTSTSAGTNLRLKIPLTLAIMPALFVRCEKERFAIPQNNLLEMVRYNPDDESEGLEYLYGTPVFRLRERLIPLVFLSQELELRAADSWSGKSLNIAVVQSSGVRFGLIVDEVLYMQEVVVKPIPSLLRGKSTYGGATILGDGRVALILDIEGIARSSGLSGKIKEYQKQEDNDSLGKSSDAEHAMLLFDLEDGDRLAIPVNQVERLENISRTKIQTSGTEAVIPYGDGIIKLVWIANYIEGSSHARMADSLSIIGHYSHGLPIGLVVNQIHDIVYVPDQLNILSPPQRGLLGCAIIDDQVINVIDVDGILGAHNNRNSINTPSLTSNMIIEEPL